MKTKKPELVHGPGIWEQIVKSDQPYHKTATIEDMKEFVNLLIKNSEKPRPMPVQALELLMMDDQSFLQWMSSDKILIFGGDKQHRAIKERYIKLTDEK